jgi:hypothetical protein
LLQAGAPLLWKSRICFKQPRRCLANPEFASSSHAPASLRLALLDSLRRRALAAGQHERARSRAVVHVATTRRCLNEASRLCGRASPASRGRCPREPRRHGYASKAYRDSVGADACVFSFAQW